MIRIDLALQEAHDRQAALRSPAGRSRPPRRPNSVRRHIGVWIVRFGRVVGGRPSPTRVLQS